MLIQSLIVIPSLIITSIEVIDVYSVYDVNNTLTIENQNSIPHNALGHELHQIVNLVNTSDDKIFHGTVDFTSTLPVDIIAYTITSKNTTSSNLWNISGNYYTTDKLLSNLTHKEADFTGSGLVSHRTNPDGFKMNFTIN